MQCTADHLAVNDPHGASDCNPEVCREISLDVLEEERKAASERRLIGRRIGRAIY